MKSTGPLQTAQRRRAGFTLLEMLLVFALIGALASVLIYNYLPTVQDTNIRTARLFVTTTGKTALVTYRLNQGRFPSTEEGLAAMLAVKRGGESAPVAYFDPPRVPVDPWGREYQYRCPGTRNPGGYDLFSLGADGRESTDDIGNWA